MIKSSQLLGQPSLQVANKQTLIVYCRQAFGRHPRTLLQRNAHNNQKVTRNYSHASWRDQPHTRAPQARGLFRLFGWMMARPIVVSPPPLQGCCAHCCSDKNGRAPRVYPTHNAGRDMCRLAHFVSTRAAAVYVLRGAASRRPVVACVALLCVMYPTQRCTGRGCPTTVLPCPRCLFS
jgi:hypothetical protein